ncbi:MAG: tRNA guanosine(34) transglycosylase Tgt, partial [Deltaproteobacteria bacterium]
MKTFDVYSTSAGRARAGVLATAHGSVRTPAFMPVGTYGTVRGLTPEQLREAGTEIVLANSYHLALRPGAETISRIGGLHRFMGWDGPILTDSGGYQLFSLASCVSLSERGAKFRSHLDGSVFEMTPERSVAIQRLLGVDIGMMFDVLTGEPGDREAAAAASERTVRWAERCRAAVSRDGGGTQTTMFFGIVQGGLFEDLRRESAEALAGMDFPGYAVGGLSVGEEHGATMEAAELTAPMLPPDKPRYMMGMGTPADIVELVGYGYDLFDCVVPTRNGRNGTLFTRCGTMAIRNSRYREDPDPVDSDCRCYTCRTFSRAYLHHLVKRREMLGA